MQTNLNGHWTYKTWQMNMNGWIAAMFIRLATSHIKVFNDTVKTLFYPQKQCICNARVLCKVKCSATSIHFLMQRQSTQHLD